MGSLPVIESCQGCGACCLRQGYPPYTDEERQYAADDLLAEIEESLAAIENEDAQDGETEGPCIWLDLESRRCLHYDDRPQVCRDFERGGEPCRMNREQHRIGESRSAET